MTAERRRARWLEPIPTVELAARLRRVPLFNYVSVDELFRFAGAAKQVRYDRGRSLFEPGSPGAVHVLIDGEVRFDDGAAVQAPGPLAFEEIFAGASFSSSVRAVDVAVTLALTQDEFLMLLSDNIDIAHGLFRTLLEARGAAARPVVRGLFDAGVAGRTERLQPMERALLLQGGALLSGAARPHVLQLADITREVPLDVGAVLSREGERAVYLVLSGAVTVETPDGARLVAGPGDAVGLLEALTDRRLEATITVSDAGAALRLDRRDLFDLLADHAELLQALVGGILRQLPPAQ
jgi:CRP-like cAMP-binding protein